MLLAQQPVIGQFIRELRQEMGLSQEKFAIKVGVTFHTINRWENGRATPSPLAMKCLEALLHQLGERGQILLAKHFQQGHGSDF
jgi:DNA-binding transcriptional regulator YiaG